MEQSVSTFAKVDEQVRGIFDISIYVNEYGFYTTKVYGDNVIYEKPSTPEEKWLYDALQRQIKAYGTQSRRTENTKGWFELRHPLDMD